MTQLDHIERRDHYRALERSWQETRDLQARMLALTGHARWVTLWSLAGGKYREYGELGDEAFNRALKVL